MSDLNTGNPTAVPMNSLAPNIRALYLQQYQQWNYAIIKLNALYDELVANPLDEYEFKSGDGSEKVKRKSLEQVGKELEYATGRLMFFHKKLYGRGLMIMRVRRK